jgi:hypothetical protein
VTNYDFDELIFPREFSVDRFPMPANCSHKVQADKAYNIYDYAKRMFDKHGAQRSCLLFDHVLYLSVNQSFFDSLKQLLTSKDGSIEQAVSPKQKMFFDMKISVNKNYVNYLLNAHDTVKCLNASLMNNTRFQAEWNNAFATRINNRDGKSIFDTKYTEGINQHFASRSSAMPYFRVPVTDGFASHFRETTSQFFYGQHQSIANFYVDSEYYMFLVNV